MAEQRGPECDKLRAADCNAFSLFLKGRLTPPYAPADSRRQWEPPHLFAAERCDRVSNKSNNADFAVLWHHPCALVPQPNATEAET